MRHCRLFIALSFALTPLILEAQEISIGNEEDRPIEERIIYTNESTVHATVHTQGLGVGYKSGKIRSIDKTTYWDFEASLLHSLKQVSLINYSYFAASSFIYGKLNDAVMLRTGYEVEHRIYGKPYWGGVEVRWGYEGGASIALLKPYYYIVLVQQPSSNGTYEQVVDYRTFDKNDEIIGKAPLKYGLKEIKVRPGLYAKGGMSFEFGTSSTRVQAIEAGAMAEYYPQGMELMAENPKEYVFLTLYLSYHWGSRYNKY